MFSFNMKCKGRDRSCKYNYYSFARKQKLQLFFLLLGKNSSNFPPKRLEKCKKNDI